MLKIYNSLTKKKEVLKPTQKEKRLNFFVCGPTVYDASHIGHARTYVFFDAAVKYLRLAGYKVFYLQNITDIDDKIIARARELGEDPLFLSRHYAKEYFSDMADLKITSVSKYAPASDFIPQIIKQVSRLIKKGYAYETPGGVYFDIAKFKDYGKLSGQNMSALKKAVRIEEDPSKHHDFDFVLWKAKKEGEPSWPSPWGEGRPGWHIEDTAISEHFFGPQYDIHGGGIELKFPHHESEIAQQEAASGKIPFVKYWMHTGHLMVGREKMSKSLKNFITIRDMLKRHSAEAFRLLILQNHYRSPLNYEEKSIGAAGEGIKRIQDFKKRLSKVKSQKSKLSARGGSASGGKITSQNSKLSDELLKKFNEAMNDDFDTPKAIAGIFDFIKNANSLIDKNGLAKKEAIAVLSALKKIDSVLGIIPKIKTAKIPEEISKLVALREKYRRTKEWGKADEIRKKLQDAGYEIKDLPRGTEIKKGA